MRQEIDPARLQQAYDRLGTEHQEIIHLARVEKLSYPGMGIRLGLTIEQVERRIALAILALERSLARQQRPWWRFW